VYRRKDAYYAKAKAAGFRSRAAFKLEQLSRKAPILRRGATVVDLGAWPGGWLQVAADKVGPHGRVIGVDLQRIEPLGKGNVRLVQGSVTDPDVQEQVRQACEGGADTILSDLAAKLTGVRARDQAMADELVVTVIAFAGRLLRPGGSLLMKTFSGADRATHLAQLRRMFRSVRETRPQATRKGSAEVYILARDFHASQ
jgi:23S rRNA (uridine2552-2'-O)-methyltransferase